MMRYYGQFKPPVDKILHESIIENWRGGFFIECGAYDGLADSNCKFLEESLGWYGINIEASPTIYHRLAANRPGAINVWGAMTNFDGKIEFTQSFRGHQEIGLGSVVPEAIEAGCRTHKVEVPAYRYKTICDYHRVKEVSLFSLDIEGHELVVLKDIMSEGGGPLPAIFCIEHGHVGAEAIMKVIGEKYTQECQYMNNSFYRRKA